MTFYLDLKYLSINRTNINCVEHTIKLFLIILEGLIINTCVKFSIYL